MLQRTYRTKACIQTSTPARPTTTMIPMESAVRARRGGQRRMARSWLDRGASFCSDLHEQAAGFLFGHVHRLRDFGQGYSHGSPLVECDHCGRLFRRNELGSRRLRVHRGGILRDRIGFLIDLRKWAE